MSNFSGSYLRVLTPKTQNGVIPLQGPDGRVVYKESHLPLTARKYLDRKNKKLPQYLKHIITEVDPSGFAESEVVATSFPGQRGQEKIAEEPKRRGRKKSNVENELDELENEQTFENE